MTDIPKSMAVSASAMAAQAARLRLSSENIANADTPGYRRKIVPFEQVYDPDAQVMKVRTGQLYLDRAQLDERYDPSHPMADERGYYQSSNVNMVIEIADAREAQRSYEANLRMFDQARKMTTQLFDLLRR